MFYGYPRVVACCMHACMHARQAVVFSGVRFEVEGSASLIFGTDSPAEFTGIDGLVRLG